MAHEPLTNAVTRATQRLASDLAFSAVRFNYIVSRMSYVYKVGIFSLV